MGILNLTPDSFYDGGRHSSLDSACRQAERLIQERADILDLGGESTRPGSKPVSVQEELRRVLPVIQFLAKKHPQIPISVDTQKSEVAYQSLCEGATIINDVSALRQDPKMVDVVRRSGSQIILMHRRGNPQTMQKNPRYKSVVDDILKFLKERAQWAVDRGIALSKIWIDPGIGFGKTVDHNLKIVQEFKKFLSLNFPLVVGASRKSFIGSLLKRGKTLLPVEDRLEGSLAIAAWSYLQGVSILRVHDVLATKRLISVLSSIQGS